MLSFALVKERSARPQLNNRIVRTNRNPEAERKDREKKNPDNSKIKRRV
jgi:hypothetical protein